MLQVLQLLAVLCATLFAGAALYISVVEHPAPLLPQIGFTGLRDDAVTRFVRRDISRRA